LEVSPSSIAVLDTPRPGRQPDAAFSIMGGGSVLPGVAKAPESPLEPMGGIDSVCPRNTL
jgi:hypothetical protein